MNITISSDILDQAGLSEYEIKLELAISLYKRGKFSLGQASKFSGLNNIEFQRELGNRGEVLNYDEDDLAQDLKNLEGFKS